uniref:pentapeptide repeat-containing protein n=1 Tax=Brevundimonas sp. TaxID=1871086 RepID=UPI003783ED16
DAYLSRADLFGANLSHANLSDADLSGANLSGADLSDAKIGAHIVARKAAQVWRYDGYEFFGFVLRDGGLLIRAGCQTRLIEDYRQHVADKYPGTAKAVETLALLDFIEARAKA